MTEIPIGATRPRPRRRRISTWVNQSIASPALQAWAARFPLTRRMVRREGEAIFELVAGFCQSQVLMALVELRVLDMLRNGPLSVERVAERTGVPVDRLRILLRAGQAAGLLKLSSHVVLSRRGAALVGVPGLQGMIEHHKILYRDLAEPAAFFRGETQGELAAFWPYVFGAEQAADPEVAERYSALMAESQALLIEDTLAALRRVDIGTLMDVGGGTGAFLAAACRRWPGIRGVLFDLPAVAAVAERKLEEAGFTTRINVSPGSFRDDPLPRGADAISLIRVLYDHDDTTVRALLQKVHAALPPGGRLVVSEPMAGGARPALAGDVYFALYTLAMKTGRARSFDEIASLCREAGFDGIRGPHAPRPFVTTVLVATKS